MDIVEEKVASNQWHFFRLRGDVRDGQVRYLEFQTDDQTLGLGQTFPAVSAPPLEQLAVALQPDANSNNDSYDFVVDQVALQWYDASPW